MLLLSNIVATNTRSDGLVMKDEKDISRHQQPGENVAMRFDRTL